MFGTSLSDPDRLTDLLGESLWSGLEKVANTAGELAQRSPALAFVVGVVITLALLSLLAGARKLAGSSVELRANLSDSRTSLKKAKTKAYAANFFDVWRWMVLALLLPALLFFAIFAYQVFSAAPPPPVYQELIRY